MYLYNHCHAIIPYWCWSQAYKIFHFDFYKIMSHYSKICICCDLQGSNENFKCNKEPFHAMLKDFTEDVLPYVFDLFWGWGLGGYYYLFLFCIIQIYKCH